MNGSSYRTAAECWCVTGTISSPIRDLNRGSLQDTGRGRRVHGQVAPDVAKALSRQSPEPTVFVERNALWACWKGGRGTINIEHLLTVGRYRGNMQETPQGTTGTKLFAMISMGRSGHTHSRTEGYRMPVLVHREGASTSPQVEGEGVQGRGSPSVSTPKGTQHHIIHALGTRIGVIHEKCIGVWTQDI